MKEIYVCIQFFWEKNVVNIISLCVCESKMGLIVTDSAEQLATVACRPPQLEPTHGKVRFRDLMSTALWVRTQTGELWCHLCYCTDALFS